MPSAPHDPIIVALDFETASGAMSLVSTLDDEASFYKVGMELYAVAGMDLVRELLAVGKQVFLDMKFYDIPETVRRAVAHVADSGVSFLTVHGSNAVMRAAVEGRKNAALKLLAITVLTSFDESDLKDLGYPCSIQDLVQLRVKNAIESGIEGIVASPLEAAAIRAQAGPGLLIVTPGVRSPGNAAADQRRVASPAEAIAAGADYLVIGRQIARASNPITAIRQIRSEIAAR